MKKNYVYKFLNKSNEVIYVGRTKNIKDRLENQHFSLYGHLPIECYEEVEKIYFLVFNSSSDMYIHEIYFINKHKPKYNTVYKDAQETKVKISNVRWEEYPITVKIENFMLKRRLAKLENIMYGNEENYDTVSICEKNDIKFKDIPDSIKYNEDSRVAGSYYFILSKVFICHWFLKHKIKPLPTCREIEILTSIPRASISRHLNKLADFGWIKKIGHGCHGKYVVTSEENECEKFLQDNQSNILFNASL